MENKTRMGHLETPIKIDDPSLSIKEGLESLAEQTRRYFICREKVYPLLLSDPENIRLDLQKAGALYHNIITSLQFKQYHRAVLYLVAFRQFCEKTFGHKRILSSYKIINSWMN